MPRMVAQEVAMRRAPDRTAPGSPAASRNSRRSPLRERKDRSHRFDAALRSLTERREGLSDPGVPLLIPALAGEGIAARWSRGLERLGELEQRSRRSTSRPTEPKPI